MANGFIPFDRSQQYLVPPSLDEWLAQDHPARFIADTLEHLDLAPFHKGRGEGVGRAAYNPKMMVGLLCYAYCSGSRSSRDIERRCREDIVFRWLCANNIPDHSTIARFRATYSKQLKALFLQSLRLCQELGLVKVGVVALDGTKMKANASIGENRSIESLQAEIDGMLTEAANADATEDGLVDAGIGGDEPDPALLDPATRLARLVKAKQRLEAEDEARRADYEGKLAKRTRHKEETGKNPCGRPLRPPEDRAEVKRLTKRANTTDPDSRVQKQSLGGRLQGYNAQATVTKEGIVIASGVVSDQNDMNQLRPMLAAAEENLEAIGAESIRVLVADAGYYTDDNATPREGDPEILIATKKDRDHKSDRVSPRGPIPKSLTVKQRMERKLSTKRGQSLYKKRAQTVEPIFGQHRQSGFNDFKRRGLEACEEEWAFKNACHNLMKVYRSGKRRHPSRLSRRDVTRSGRTPLPCYAWRLRLRL